MSHATSIIIMIYENYAHLPKEKKIYLYEILLTNLYQFGLSAKSGFEKG